jgi:hypothetical protein
VKNDVWAKGLHNTAYTIKPTTVNPKLAEYSTQINKISKTVSDYSYLHASWTSSCCTISYTRHANLYMKKIHTLQKAPAGRCHIGMTHLNAREERI